MPTPPPKPIIFISYAHADEPEKPAEGEIKWLSFVTGYLRPAVKHGAVDLWIDRLMRGGDAWDPKIERQLRDCDIFILLVSRHSMSSDYIVDKEIAIIRERQANGDRVHFYPLLLTPTPKIALDKVGDKNIRPRDAKPLSSFPISERDQQMTEIANEIVQIAAEIANRESEPPPLPPMSPASPPSSPHVDGRRGVEPQFDPERWEVAHDFVARLLQPLLRIWRNSSWEATRPWFVPASLAIWLIVVGGAIIFYPSLHEEHVLSKLRVVGLVPGPPDEGGGATFVQNGAPIKDAAQFWRTAFLLLDLRYPVVGLRINNTTLATLQGMPALPALTWLDLHGDKALATLQGMPLLPALTSLDLRFNSLATLQGMPLLPALTSLDLSYNETLATLQGMPALPALTWLDLHGDKAVATLEGMPALPALTSLDLSFNSLATLQGMPALTALTSLNLRYNDLASLQGMPLLPGLTSLDLSNNRIRTLRGMPALPGLTSLNLSGNSLSPLPGMQQVLPCPTSLDLSGGNLVPLRRNSRAVRPDFA